jgi:hypothetical protein
MLLLLLNVKFPHEALTEAFKHTQDGKESFLALRELRETRLVTKEKWREWNAMIRSRFKEEQLRDDEILTKVTKRERIDEMRTFKSGKESWRQTAESWHQRLMWGYREADRAGQKFRLQHARPRLKAPRRLWIQVFTNRPIEDTMANEWKLMKIEVGPKYTLQEIYHKVRSRWKDRWKVDWDEEEMDPWIGGEKKECGRRKKSATGLMGKELCC